VQRAAHLIVAQELILELSNPAIALFDRAIAFFDPNFAFFDPRLQDSGVLVSCAATFDHLLMKIVAGALPLPDFDHVSLPGLLLKRVHEIRSLLDNHIHSTKRCNAYSPGDSFFEFLSETVVLKRWGMKLDHC